MTCPQAPPIERRFIRLSGVVQGVGMRPFVYAVAQRLGLGGHVRNAGADVLIEVEGAPSALASFVAALDGAPAPAAIELIESAGQPPAGETRFRIDASAIPSGGESALAIAPDLAPCPECLEELRDPRALRHGYPFLSCAHCGPRLTIVRGLPYDRERTTMAAFSMCPRCRAEYDDPADRRFHAQPLACPTCGPALSLRDRGGRAVAGADPLAAAAAALLAGGIVACKNLGGYHLACDARDERAVQELRRRKQRDGKPFAVLVADLAAAERLCTLASAERELLAASARPIVLLRRRAGAAVAPAVAPAGRFLGLMLPATPLQHLLCDRVGGAPLVMTSGNLCDEPIAFRDGEAVVQLGALADLWLTHDRPIEIRCDDSVSRVVAGRPLPVRRSRGYAPAPLSLPLPAGCPTLAFGGHLKSTIAFAEGTRAVVSHHIGDLDTLEACSAFEETVEHYLRLHRVVPQRLVHDDHPDYASSRLAERRPEPRLSVQHHHAHMAACLAEHQELGPAIGVCFDGAGLGPDGALWGGELLVGGLARVRRAAHLRYVPLPGGEAAMRAPWRMALAHLWAAGLDQGDGAGERFADLDPGERRGVRALLRRGDVRQTSSVGRLFDAVAALLGICTRARFDGEAAMLLESLADTVPAAEPYPFHLLEEGDEILLDPRPLIAAVAADAGLVDGALVARRFHATLAAMVMAVSLELRRQTGLHTVALSGGVFVNAILTEECERRLRAADFRVLTHRRVPPNDGGLSYGQLAVAAAQDHVGPACA